MSFKMSAKCCRFCLDLSVLTEIWLNYFLNIISGCANAIWFVALNKKQNDKAEKLQSNHMMCKKNHIALDKNEARK